MVKAKPRVREFVAEVLSEQGYSVLSAATTAAALPLLLTATQPDSPALIEQPRASFPGLKVIFLAGGVEQLPAERGDFWPSPLPRPA